MGGLEPLTLIDFEGHVAAVWFSQGCPLRCPYCHNPQLLPLAAEGTCPPTPIEHWLAWLAPRRRMLTGVVVSGGEATLQPGLPALLRGIKALGLATKLDTNGLYPERLAALLEDALLDYVALDVKAPPERYGTLLADATQGPGIAAKIGQSLALLRQAGVAYECRTTVAAPLLTPADVLSIGQWVKGVPVYALQRFRAVAHPLALPGASALQAYSDEAMLALQQALAPLVGRCVVR
jgi:pyruvate formate lyase activating enzyme